MEKDGLYSLVLCADGTFRRIRSKAAADVGEEIQIPAGWQVRPLTGWLAAAAVVLVMLSAALGWNMWQEPTAVAYVSVDINPSLELALDEQGQVIAASAHNEDASDLLAGLDLNGLSLNSALDEIVKAAVDGNYLSAQNHWVVLGVAADSSGLAWLDGQQLADRVYQSAAMRQVIPQVAVFEVSGSERQTAQESDLTAGEYALWQTAGKAGVKVPSAAVRNSHERANLLEQSRVQEQIRADKNTLELGEADEQSGQAEEGVPQSSPGSVPGATSPANAGKSSDQKQGGSSGKTDKSGHESEHSPGDRKSVV